MFDYRIVFFVLLAGCAPVSISGYGNPNQVVSVSKKQKHPNVPDLKKTRNGRYKVRKPWTVKMNGRVWKVEKGYLSNGITAPDKIKKSLGDGVEYPETWAAVFHDWLFTQKGISRSQADNLFYELLKAYDVPEEKARLMFTSVSAYSFSKMFR